MYVSLYEQGNCYNYDLFWMRKLLMYCKEINKLIGLIKEKGYFFVLLKLYLKNGFVKVFFGFGKGKKNYDKWEDLKCKDVKCEIERVFRDS